MFSHELFYLELEQPTTDSCSVAVSRILLYLEIGVQMNRDSLGLLDASMLALTDLMIVEILMFKFIECP